MPPSGPKYCIPERREAGFHGQVDGNPALLQRSKHQTAEKMSATAVDGAPPPKGGLESAESHFQTVLGPNGILHISEPHARCRFPTPNMSMQAEFIACLSQLDKLVSVFLGHPRRRTPGLGHLRIHPEAPGEHRPCSGGV
jgi:hypothetical protein